jgi:hypothetical protein
MEPLYHLTDPTDAQRLRELAGVPDPTNLESDLAMARLMCEKAYNAGQFAASASLQNIIAKLTQASESAKYKRGDLLAKGAILAIADRFVELLSANIANRFPGWEESLDKIRQGVLTVVMDARNAEPGLLEDNSGK